MDIIFFKYNSKGILNMPKTLAQSIIEREVSDRIIDDSKICSFVKTERQVQKWKKNNKFVIFRAGAFDLFTVNHILGLVNSRILGAMCFLGIKSISNDRELHLVHKVVVSDKLRLMITLDSNQELEKNKSRKRQKGNCLRPILDWKTRAMMLAMQSISDAHSQKRVHLVDYVTKHGLGCCPVCTENKCVNNNNSSMAIKLQPDLVIVSSRSKTTVREINNYKRKGMLGSISVIIVDEKQNQYFDKVLGGPIKTTTIIRRIKMM